MDCFIFFHLSAAKSYLDIWILPIDISFGKIWKVWKIKEKGSGAISLQRRVSSLLLEWLSGKGLVHSLVIQVAPWCFFGERKAGFWCRVTFHVEVILKQRNT